MKMKREYKQIAQFQQIDKFKEWYDAEISAEKWARTNRHVGQQFDSEHFYCRFTQGESNKCPVRLLIKHYKQTGEVSVEQSGKHEHDHQSENWSFIKEQKTSSARQISEQIWKCKESQNLDRAINRLDFDDSEDSSSSSDSHDDGDGDDQNYVEENEHLQPIEHDDDHQSETLDSIKEQKKLAKASSARQLREQLWKCKESGMSIEEIAAKFELAPNIVKSRLGQYKKQNGLARNQEEFYSSSRQIREQIWRCRESGMSLDEIAAKFGMTTNSVQIRLAYHKKLNGLTRKKEKLDSSNSQLWEQLWRCKESGMSIKEIAAKFEMKATTVKGRLDLYKRQNGLARNQEELYSSSRQLREQIWKCREAGMSYEEIAAKFNKAKSSIISQCQYHVKKNGIVLQNSKERTTAQRKVAASADRNPPSETEMVEEILTLYDDGESINAIVRKLNYPEHEIRFVCKEARAQNLDRAINRLDFDDKSEVSSSSSDSHDDGDDQNNKVEDEHLQLIEHDDDHQSGTWGSIKEQKRRAKASSDRQLREQIWKYKESGMSLDEIAAKFEMAPNIVQSRLNYYRRHNGLSRKKEELYSSARQFREQLWRCKKSGMSIKEIAAKFEMKPKNVKSRLEHYKKLNSLTRKKEELYSSARQLREQIWKCRDSGMSYDEIATKFNKAKSSIISQCQYHVKKNGIVLQNSKERTTAQRKVAASADRNPPSETEMVEEILTLYDDGESINEIVRNSEHKIRFVCKKARAQNEDHANNRLDFDDSEDSSSSDSDDDGEDQNNIEGSIKEQKKPTKASSAREICEQIWKCRESGMSLDEIAAKFELAPNIVKSKLNYYKQLNGLTRKRKEWHSSARQIREQIWKCRQSGMSVEETAAKFNKTKSSIVSQCRNYKRQNGLIKSDCKNKKARAQDRDINRLDFDVNFEVSSSSSDFHDDGDGDDQNNNVEDDHLHPIDHDDDHQSETCGSIKEQKRLTKASSARQISEEIWKCKETGMSLDEIAAKFDMTPDIVKGKLNYYKKLNGLARKQKESASQLREQLWRCKESGTSIKKIAAKFEMAPNGVKARLDLYKKQNGLARKREDSSSRQIREQIWRCRESGMSIKEIAAKFELAPNIVIGRLNHHKKLNGLARKQEELYSSSRQLREQIWKCRESGMSLDEIAAKFDKTKTSIKSHCYYYRKQNDFKIKSVCKKAMAQNLDHVINRLKFMDSSSSDSSDDSEHQNNVEDEHLHPTEEQTQPSTSTFPRNQRTLYSRFHVQQEFSKYIYCACSTNYKIKLFQLKPLTPSIDALLPRHGLDDEGLSALSNNKMKKFNALVNNKLGMAHQLYNYECPDCNFQLVGQPFIPIVYLVIDHFIDCPTHLVAKMVRKLFLEERERFNAFLGANFNHAYALPKDAQLEFFKWDPRETFHCSLSLADGDGQLEDGKLPIDRQQSFLTDEEAETENDEWDGTDEEDNDGIEEDSGKSDAECSDGSSEEEDLEGDDENEPWNRRDESSLIDEFGDLNVPGYDDDDSF